MKYAQCPKCKKQLIRLESYEKGIYTFWCDDCDIDIQITENDKIEKEND